MELINVEAARANVTAIYNTVRDGILNIQIPDYIARLNEAIDEASKKGYQSITRNLPPFDNTDLGQFASRCFIEELTKVIRNAGYTIEYQNTICIVLRW